ncbi:MAG: O-antigen ligase family protein [Clostridiaceae bacterium]|nr:O-antigen ligase family protein [Clostridiaceae bacterium]
MKRISLDKAIKLILFMYILSIYLFTYREGLFVVSNGIALMFIIAVFVKILAFKSVIVFNRFLLYQVFFIFICVASYFYAVKPNNAITDVRTLALIFIVMFTIVNYIDTKERLFWAVKSFIVSGFIASIYIIAVSDFTVVVRYGSELGNTNAVGLMIGISLIFSINEYYREKKRRYLIAVLPMFIVIILTGSRKSLLFVIIAALFISYCRDNGSLKNKIKFLLISTIMLSLVYYLVMEVPIFYQVLGKRIESMIALFIGEGKVDRSTATRQYMIEAGIDLFKQRPFFGYGAQNYQVMFGMLTGMDRYSHNNFIELLVNVGIIGTFSYYLTNLRIVKDLLKFFKEYKNKDLIYAFIAVIFAYFLLGTALVYYDSKHFSFLLAIASVIPNVYYKEAKNENEYKLDLGE